MAERENDIKAPDGYTVGGERLVRTGGVVLFNRGWWQLPTGFAERGEYVWVHEDVNGDLEVAPPGYRNFSAAVLDRKTVIALRNNRPDAKPTYRRPERKAWAARMQGA